MFRQLLEGHGSAGNVVRPAIGSADLSCGDKGPGEVVHVNELNTYATAGKEDGPSSLGPVVEVGLPVEVVVGPVDVGGPQDDGGESPLSMSLEEQVLAPRLVAGVVAPRPLHPGTLLPVR